MTTLVAQGAALKCSFGMSPGSLSVHPARRTNGQNLPLATVLDMNPMVNVAPFGLCKSPSNPQVAAATAAAMGTLTPQPCLPVTTTPWAPGSATVFVENEAALTADSKCTCQWGGVIEVVAPGQTGVQAG